MTRDKEFAIGTYEINLLDKNDLKSTFKTLQRVCKYVDTAIDYDNDYVLPKVLKKSTKIISKISSCHYSNYGLFVDSHLKCLKRDKIDIMLIHSDRGDWEPLAKRMVDDGRFIEKGVSNFNAEEIERYHAVTGKWPYANEIEINPYYTDIATIDFCKSHGIKVIAYATLGGKYDSWRTVARYGLGNTLAYALSYADIAIVRANSSTEAGHFADVIKSFNFDLAKPITVMSGEADKKAIKPMDYKVPDIKCNFFLGKPTYLREMGLNDSKSINAIISEEEVKINLPKLEMLGDYKTYVRYKYGSSTYFGDWLKVGKSKYIAVYLWDKDGKLTKVGPDAVDIKVVQYEAR